MLEIVRTIREGLGIESTWAFVLAIGLLGGAVSGGMAWLVDRAYRQSSAESKAVAAPVNDSLGAMARQLTEASRPWLFIVSETIVPDTGRIRLLIQNRGKTPAYDVKVEHWGEVSKQIPKYAEVIPVDKLPPAFEENQRLMKFFDKEYDTRQQLLPRYGGRSASAHIAMLLPDDTFQYDLTDYTPELIKQLELKAPRQTRLAGKITYTDQQKTLQPDYPFCYQVLTLRDKNGHLQHRSMRCPDLDLNQSR